MLIHSWDLKGLSFHQSMVRFQVTCTRLVDG